MMQDLGAIKTIDELRETCQLQQRLILELVAGVGIMMDRMHWDDLGQQFADKVMPLMQELKARSQPTSGADHG